MKKNALFLATCLFGAWTLFGESGADWMLQTNLLAGAKENSATNLPNVLILGDSISMGYTPFVQKRMAGIANVSRPKCNCGPTQFYLRPKHGMRRWVGKTSWRAIVVNFGIWDVCYMRGDPLKVDHFWGSKEIPKGLPPCRKATAIRDLGFRVRTPVREYEANMREILGYLKTTGAQVFFALTTPVPGYDDDRNGRIRVYNEIAESVCAELGVGVIDLHAVAERNYDKVKDGCHFNDAGNDILAEAIVTRLKSTLFPAVLSAHPLANEEVLEPSVLNEVDHALSLVPTNAVPPTAAAADFAKLYATNGLSATQRAIALVSSQKGGSWFWQGTNVTPVAVHLLRQAAGYPEPTCPRF